MERLTRFNAYFNEYELKEELDTNKLRDKSLKGKDLGACVIQRLGEYEQLCEEFGVKSFNDLVKIVRKYYKEKV